jgi:tetratricopeptide (TPR) repeat protein
MSRRVFASTVVLALVCALSLTAGGRCAKAAGQFSVEQGQRYIDEGRYDRAIREFTGVIEDDPTHVEGYRGRIEAELLLGQYSNALRDNALITAFVLPVHPDAKDAIFAEYDARLAATPKNVAALTGASFAHWTSFDYPTAIHLLNRLLTVQPKNRYGNLFRGSSRLLHHSNTAGGIADLENGIALAPKSADVRFIVADAYTYGLPDAERAFEEASLALDWGLDTPRIHAILAVSYAAFGDELAAAAEIEKHIELVTTELVPAAPIAPGATLSLPLVPGRTYEIPVAAAAGESISIMTGSLDFYDTILVLLAPDETPVLGSDDYIDYFAGFTWVAPVGGTYYLLVTSFESIDTGELVVTRD